MRPAPSIPFSVLAALSLVCLASPAFAQPAAPGRLKVATVEKVDGHDVYDFPDDALAGETLGASVVRIPVLRHAARASLVRPRLSFVPELLKSAGGM